MHQYLSTSKVALTSSYTKKSQTKFSINWERKENNLAEKSGASANYKSISTGTRTLQINMLKQTQISLIS